MRLNKLLFGIISLSFIFSAFAVTPATNLKQSAIPESTNEAGTDYTSPDKSIIVDTVHPSFVIQLRSNRTTGYSWLLKNYNPVYLSLVTHKYIPPDVARPGAGGYELWEFQANPAMFIAPIATSIDMIYAQPWQVKDAKVVSFDVVSFDK